MQKDDFRKGEILIYQTPQKEIQLDVRLKEETVWLTQKQMALLFDKGIPAINEHIKNVFKEGELEENSVIRKFRITAADGKMLNEPRFDWTKMLWYNMPGQVAISEVEKENWGFGRRSGR